MLFGKNDGFNYTYPRSLALALKYHQSTVVPKLPYFNNFFRRLNVLHCSSFSSLYCVSLKHVFIKHRNYYANSESCDNIDVFRVVAIGGLLSSERQRQAAIKQVDVTCKNFDRLILDYSNSPDRIRGIKQFKLESFVVADAPEYINCVNSLSKRLFLRFGSISKSIHLLKTKLTFDSISEINRFFHPDLKHIYFNSYSSIVININVDVKNVEHSVGSLQHIAFDTNRFRQDVPSRIDTLNAFDKLGIRRNIKQYTLHWIPPYTADRIFGMALALDIGTAVSIFDKIFFQDYDKHPLLESIIIKFNDNKYLFGIARLLLYFHQHYQQLFVERNLYLAHFQTIEIHIDNVWTEANGELERYPHDTSNQEFFEQERNNEYSIDDQIIEIKSSKFEQEIESFGIIYQNIFYWLQRMKKKSGKIVFDIE